MGRPSRRRPLEHAIADLVGTGPTGDSLITGAGGQLGQALAEAFPEARALTRTDWDVTQPAPAELEGAGLVIKERKGREQLVRGNVETTRRAYRLLEQLEAVWQARMDRIGDLLAEDEQEGSKQ